MSASAPNDADVLINKFRDSGAAREQLKNFKCNNKPLFNNLLAEITNAVSSDDNLKVVSKWNLERIINNKPTTVATVCIHKHYFYGTITGASVLKDNGEFDTQIPTLVFARFTGSTNRVDNVKFSITPASSNDVVHFTVYNITEPGAIQQRTKPLTGDNDKFVLTGTTVQFEQTVRFRADLLKAYKRVPENIIGNVQLFAVTPVCGTTAGEVEANLILGAHLQAKNTAMLMLHCLNKAVEHAKGHSKVCLTPQQFMQQMRLLSDSDLPETFTKVVAKMCSNRVQISLNDLTSGSGLQKVVPTLWTVGEHVDEKVMNFVKYMDDELVQQNEKTQKLKEAVETMQFATEQEAKEEFDKEEERLKEVAEKAAQAAALAKKAGEDAQVATAKAAEAAATAEERDAALAEAETKKKGTEESLKSATAQDAQATEDQNKADQERQEADKKLEEARQLEEEAKKKRDEDERKKAEEEKKKAEEEKKKAEEALTEAAEKKRKAEEEKKKAEEDKRKAEEALAEAAEKKRKAEEEKKKAEEEARLNQEKAKETERLAAEAAARLEEEKQKSLALITQNEAKIAGTSNGEFVTACIDICKQETDVFKRESMSCVLTNFVQAVKLAEGDINDPSSVVQTMKPDVLKQDIVNIFDSVGAAVGMFMRTGKITLLDVAKQVLLYKGVKTSIQLSGKWTVLQLAYVHILNTLLKSQGIKFEIPEDFFEIYHTQFAMGPPQRAEFWNFLCTVSNQLYNSAKSKSSATSVTLHCSFIPQTHDVGNMDLNNVCRRVSMVNTSFGWSFNNQHHGMFHIDMSFTTVLYECESTESRARKSALQANQP